MKVSPIQLNTGHLFPFQIVHLVLPYSILEEEKYF